MRAGVGPGSILRTGFAIGPSLVALAPVAAVAPAAAAATAFTRRAVGCVAGCGNRCRSITVGQRGFGVRRRDGFGRGGAFGLFGTCCIAITSTASTTAAAASTFANFTTFGAVGPGCSRARLRIDEGRGGQGRFIRAGVVVDGGGARITLLAISTTASAPAATLACLAG